MGGRRVLIVRHGAGRGRLRRYMHEVLTYLRRTRPALSRHLVLHSTGEPLPDWGGIGTVVFWLGDPLRELYPACYHEALGLANEARRRQLRLINAPESLSNSIKSVQASAWRAAGIRTPPVARFEHFADLLAASQRFDYPLLVRGDERHVQQGIGLYRDRVELTGANPADLPFPCAVSPFSVVKVVSQKTAHRGRRHSPYQACILFSRADCQRPDFYICSSQTMVLAGTRSVPICSGP